MGNRGKDFEKEFRWSARMCGIWVHRLYDQIPQPGDYFLVKEGTACLCELKSTHKNRFPLSEVRPNQYYGLLVHSRDGGGLSYIVIRFYEKKGVPGASTALYGLSVEEYDKLLAAEVKSLSRAELDSNPNVIALQKTLTDTKRHWDLRPLWNKN